MHARIALPTTYKACANLWTGLARRGGLACLLGVLQGCIGADAVSPVADEAPVPTIETRTLRVTRVLPDTVVAGSTLVIEGEHLPASLTSVTVVLGGITLAVRAASTTQLEAVIPAGTFPCTPTRPQLLRLAFKDTVVERMVPLRVASVVSLQHGEQRTLSATAASACIEVAAPSGTANAEYALAVMNTSTDPSRVATFELRGTGVGALAGVVGAAPAAAGLPMGAMLPAQHDLPAATDDAQHGAHLSAQQVALRTAPSAATAWQNSRPTAARAMVTAPLAVGDIVSRSALYNSCATGTAIRTRVVYAGTRALVLEDVNAPRAGQMDQSYRQIGEEFDRVVYPLLATQLGNPLALNGTMGGDGRVTLLFTRFVNDSLPGVAGYVNACDLYPRSTFAASNQDEVIYARVAAPTESPDEWRRAMRSTLVHEGKHLTSFAERLSRNVAFEEPWLEEATARIAEELYARTFAGGGSWRGNTAFATSVGCELVQCDDRPLIMWKHFSVLHRFLQGAESLSPLGAVSSSDFTPYASGWSLVRATVDAFATNESAWLRALVQGTSGTGVAGLAALAGRSTDQLLQHWVASLMMAPSADTSAPSTWNTESVWRGMAATFPGVFSSSPLQRRAVTFGEWAVRVPSVRGYSASVLSISGAQTGGQVIELRQSTGPQPVPALQLHVQRVR